MRSIRKLVVGSAIVGLTAGLSGGCSSARPAPNGSCAADDRPELRCGAPIDAGLGDSLGLRGYTCTGTARPDLDGAKYVDGVPEGVLCADRGSLDGGVTQSYCCTTYTTSCVYNPTVVCDSPTYGYSCLGSDRPESLNAALFCSQGIRDDALIDYCCSGSEQPDGCLQSDAVGCAASLTGFLCKSNAHPKAEQLGSNKSRADYYYLLCPVGTPTTDPTYTDKYCCYAAAPVPVGATCEEDTVVPGCQPGRFGFACYGPDTPEEDYLPMHCPEPGFLGKSAEGYPATLYCCDLQ